MNDFLESFVEINEKFNVKDFKDNIQKQIVTDCIMILSSYCIGGSEGRKKVIGKYHSKRSGKSVKKEEEIAVYNPIFISQFEYFALTKLRLSGSHFWNLTLDRFMKLVICFEQDQMEQKKQLNKPNKTTPEEFDSLKKFMKKHKNIN